MIQKKEALGSRILLHSLCACRCLSLIKVERDYQLITAANAVWDNGNVSQEGVDSGEGMQIGKLVRKSACEKTRCMRMHDSVHIFSLFVTIL